MATWTESQLKKEHVFSYCYYSCIIRGLLLSYQRNMKIQKCPHNIFLSVPFVINNLLAGPQKYIALV